MCVYVCFTWCLFVDVMGLPLYLSSHRSRFCNCLLSSHRSGFCDYDGGCFMIWKRKVVVGPLFFSLWWILVATVEVDAGSAMAKVAVTIAIGFCGGCFYIILKYCIYYFK